MGQLQLLETSSSGAAKVAIEFGGPGLRPGLDGGNTSPPDASTNICARIKYTVELALTDQANDVAVVSNR